MLEPENINKTIGRGSPKTDDGSVRLGVVEFTQMAECFLATGIIYIENYLKFKR